MSPGGVRAAARRSRRAAWRAVLAVLVLAAALAATAANPPAGLAAVTNLFPANVIDETPTDVLETDDGLEAVGTATVRGADLCVVPVMTSDPGDGSLTCDAPAWGDTNPLITLGTFFLPLEPPTLRLGTWRLLADGGADGEEPDKLSQPFSVVTCDACDPSPALSAFNAWKASAGETADRGEIACALYNTSGSTNLKTVTRQAVTDLSHGTPTVVVLVSAAGGFAFAGLLDEAPQIAQLDKWLAVLHAVTCRAAAMYRAIANDPPDPDYTQTAAVAPAPLPLLPDKQVSRLDFALDALRVLGQQELNAVERFQGAQADANDEWMDKQSRAAAASGLEMAALMRTTADGLDELATRLQAGGHGTAALTQNEFDAAKAFSERVRDSGFTTEEIASINAGPAALYGQELASLIGSEPFPAGAVGKSLVQATGDMAASFRAQADDQERFAQAMLDVAPRRATPAVTAVISSPVSDQYTHLAPFPARYSSADSRGGSAPIVSRKWAFDGEPGEDAVTTAKLFATPGSHTVSLTVTDADGGTDTATRTVSVVDRSSIQLPNCHDDQFGGQQFQCPGYDPLPWGGALTVAGSGPQQLTVTHTDHNGVFQNGLFWLRVDDAQGRIDGVDPGEEGWMAGAIARGREIFPPADPTPTTVTLDVQGGDHLVFGLTSNASFATTAIGNPRNVPDGPGAFMFPFDAANQGGTAQVLPYRRQSDKAIQLGFEDIAFGGDNYVDDILMVTGADLKPNTGLGVRVSARSSEVAPGADVRYQVRIDGSGLDTILDSITATLPEGFTYVPGSSAGASASDPQINGRTLTWSGRFTVPGAGVAGVRFTASAASREDTYLTEATADARGFPITPSGASAPVRVVAGAKPSPAAPAGSVPAPVAPPKLKALDASAAFSLPSAKRCVSRRSFTIRIRKLTGVQFVRATVLVNGRRVKVVRGARLNAPVNLKGLPAGRIRVKITAVARDGRTVSGSRQYRTCAPKRRPGTTSPKL